MRILNDRTEDHSEAFASEAPFVWLFEIQAPTDPPTRYRVARFDKVVQYREDDEGERLSYSPLPISLEAVEQDGEGSLPTIDIVVENTGALMSSAVALAGGFVGQPFKIILVSTEALDDPNPAFEEDAEVVECGMSADKITFRVAAANLSTAKFPPAAYSARTCGVNFGGPLCGYNKLAVGAGFARCGVTTGGVTIAQPFSLAACVAVGDDEESNLGVRLHPARFGGQPGMRRRGR